MNYFLYPIRDAFITDHPDYIYKNTGLDEILEIEKSLAVDADGSISGSLGTVLSRALIKFDLNQISASLVNGNVTNPKFYLNLKVAESNEVPVYYTLAAYPLASDWSMGTGYKYDGSSKADGVNWKFSDGVSASWWVSESLSNYDGGGIWYTSPSGTLGSGSGYAEPPFINPHPYDPFPYCTGSVPTGSSSSSVVVPPSGAFQCFQVFNYQTADVHMDVTSIINTWLSGSLPNHGFVILHNGETDPVDYGRLRFFSKETNTIYSPCLNISWDDSVFNTGSGSGSTDPFPTNDPVVSIKNLHSSYKAGSVIRFDVLTRPRYVIKTFTNKLSDYLVPYYLPYNSFYSIRDAESSMVFIPYSDSTRLSYTGSIGNYFTIDTTALPQERYFKISIRSEFSDSQSTFDISTAFKISR